MVPLSGPLLGEGDFSINEQVRGLTIGVDENGRNGWAVETDVVECRDAI